MLIRSVTPFSEKADQYNNNGRDADCDEGRSWHRRRSSHTSSDYSDAGVYKTVVTRHLLDLGARLATS
jgi:hypothetical protein